MSPHNTVNDYASHHGQNAGMRAIARSTFLVAVLTLSGMLGVASAHEQFTPTEDPVAGARLFNSKGCVRCHAVNGVGGSVAPDLGRIARPRSFYTPAAALWNHLPQMAPQMRSSPGERPYVTPNEMSDLIAFFYGPRTSGEKLPGEPGDARRGGQLVMNKGCLACHSLEPPGGKTAGSLSRLKGVDSPWTIISSVWNHGFLMQSMTAGTGAWPRLTSDEMADLVAYLRIHGYAGR
jgi:mono/diheme cytochrome c family protein